ncbi:hypothetical protein FBZ98_105430 [Rhizobium sp. ERR 922]|nr:hypothetical protein FBZ98_105430 [Rhizobium sp. ERR 922]TWB94367.1 hypothetical protein FBZ97_105430 [Rhizobium sp. ERR 942]
MKPMVPNLPNLRHPPLSLRDISPTRGEIVGSLRHLLRKPLNSVSADSMFDKGTPAPQVTDLPPCGGDVPIGTEGGIVLHTRCHL